MNLKNHIPAVVGALSIVAIAGVVALYLLTLPSAETRRKAVATAPAATSSGDEAAQAAAERYAGNSEKTFNSADKRGRASDTLTDACTGKPIPAGAPTHDVTSRTDCVAAPSPTPVKAPKARKPRIKPQRVRQHAVRVKRTPRPTTPPTNPLRYCADRGTCPLTDARARAATTDHVRKLAKDPDTISWHVGFCNRQSPYRVDCDYVIKFKGGCNFTATLEVIQPTYQHALQYAGPPGECL